MTLPVSQAGRRYGRKQPAKLPPHRLLFKEPLNLNPVVDLRAWIGPIKDQGDEGSCTAHAGTSALEWVARKYFPQWGAVEFSPAFTYSSELIRTGDFPNDVGSDGTTLCTSLIQDGCCDASVDPYVAGQIQQPTDDQKKNALEHHMGAFHGLIGSQTAWSVLADPVPWPVLIGFTVYQSFESTWSVAGCMPVPDTTTEQVLGGHEVLAVGCDLGDTPQIRPAGSPPSYLIQNSWGAGWGLSGLFWMPAQVLDAADTDLKIAHTGHPWVVTQ